MSVKRKPGRPPGQGKPPGEKWRGLMVRMPPEMLGEFQRIVPIGSRAAVIRDAIEIHLRGLARRAPGQEVESG